LEVAQFESTGEVSEIEVQVDLKPGANLAICRTVDGADEVLLRSLPSEI
jgi:hypothetical protein